MTVSYTGNFVKCLFRWKGSVWKAVWKSLFIWLFCYSIIHVFLFYLLPLSWSRQVHSLVKMFEEYTRKLPIEFLLGFYVGQVIKRWWDQVKSIPWPDDVLSLISAYIHGQDEQSLSKRRSVCRYLTLSIILALRQVSTHIKSKITAFSSLIECGLMTQSEADLLSKASFEQMNWDLPLQWVQQIVHSRVGLGVDDIPPPALATIVVEINKIRSSLRLLTMYNWIVLPLVYTQTVTVVVYGYFAFSLFGHQFESGGNNSNVSITFLTIMQFIFYVGWLKVAEVLHKPFGDDDDDVELGVWIQRHVKTGLMLSNYGKVGQKDMFDDSDVKLDKVASLFAKPTTEYSNLLGFKK